MEIDVTAIEIRDYAMSQEWKLVREALDDGIYLLNSPGDDYAQVMLPRDESAVDFQKSAWIAVEDLAEYHRKTSAQVIGEIRSVNDDVLALRYYTDRQPINSISFQEALQAMEGTKQLILAAASSVVNPSLYHPRMARSEPLELLKKARFRHTQEGSFIIQVSCPFDMVMPPPNLLGEQGIEKPLGRASLELANQSSKRILDAIDTASIDSLFAEEKGASAPGLSYNFCHALTQLYDEERELPFQLLFQWSPASRKKLPLPNLPQRIDFPFSFREKLEEVKAYFAPPRRDISAMFSATVEALDGEFNADDRREGAVMLSVLYENEIVGARAHLPADFHSVAIKAYQTPGAFIQLKGDLKRGRRLNVLENITEFNLRG